MQVTLETRYSDGTVQFSNTYDVADVREALAIALNFTWGRGVERADGGYYLNPDLLVNGKPVADVLAQIDAAASRKEAA